MDSERLAFMDEVRIVVPRDATLARVAAAIMRATGVPRDRQRLIKASVVGTNVTGREILTNVVMGVPPSPEDVTDFPSPPLDELHRVVGDGLRLTTDLNMYFSGKVTLYVEEQPAPVCTQAFDPFNPTTEHLKVDLTCAATVSVSNELDDAAFGPRSFGPSDADAATNLSSAVVPPVASELRDRDNRMTYYINPAFIASSSSSCAQTANRSTHSFDSERSERGFRSVTKSSSRVIALLDTQANLGRWTYREPGSGIERTLEIDVRCSAHELYVAMSTALNMPFGTFQLQKEVYCAKSMIRLSDLPNSLVSRDFPSTKDGALIVTLGPTLQANQFLASVSLYVAPADVVHGTSWAPFQPPPPPPQTANGNSGVFDGASDADATSQVTDDWLPLPVVIDPAVPQCTPTLSLAHETEYCRAPSADHAATLKPLCKLGISSDSTVNDIRHMCIPVLVGMGLLVEARSDVRTDFSHAPSTPTALPDDVAAIAVQDKTQRYPPELLRRVRVRTKVGHHRPCCFFLL
jgi:hypothetical protein